MIDEQEKQDEEAVFAAMAEALAPQPLPAQVRERMRARILRAATAPPPPGTQTIRTSDADDGWIAPSDFLRLKLLHVDELAGSQEVLIRFLPGVEVPAHSHTKEEEMTILEGECHVGEHLLCAGDVHVAPPGSWHPVITSRTGALVLLRCEYPFPV